jgi:hypothetical protein
MPTNSVDSGYLYNQGTGLGVIHFSRFQTKAQTLHPFSKSFVWNTSKQKACIWASSQSLTQGPMGEEIPLATSIKARKSVLRHVVAGLVDHVALRIQIMPEERRMGRLKPRSNLNVGGGLFWIV